VIRGGAGVFYDRTGANPIQDILRFDGHRLLRVVLSNPSYPDPLQGGQTLSAEPPSPPAGTTGKPLGAGAE